MPRYRGERCVDTRRHEREHATGAVAPVLDVKACPCLDRLRDTPTCTERRVRVVSGGTDADSGPAPTGGVPLRRMPEEAAASRHEPAERSARLWTGFVSGTWFEAPWGVSDLETPSLTPSATKAFRWAVAAAACRTAVPGALLGSLVEDILHARSSTVVEAGDLLLGVLLSHPDADGEGRVLLAHFGLTARDVLPEGYPRLEASRMGDAARHVGSVTMDRLPLASDLSHIGKEGGPTTTLRELLAQLMSPSTPLRWTEALAQSGYAFTQVVSVYQTWMHNENDGPSGTGSSGFGGHRLREVLAKELPRQPMPLPRYASDRVDGSVDLVGIGAETDAFARLIASCDLVPPLAVGLFGDWGSGKSFLIDAVKRRVETFQHDVADKDQHEVRVWKRTVQIDFNAWEYVQGSLWAGLLQRIFAELGTVGPTIFEARRTAIQGELDRAKDGLAEHNRKVDEQTDLVNVEATKVEEARARVKAAAEEAERIAAAARQNEIESALRQTWGPLAGSAFGQRQAEELTQALADTRTELVRGRALAGLYWQRPWRLAVITLAGCLVPLVAWALNQADVGGPASVLGGLAAGVPVVTTTLARAATWTRRRLDEIEKVEAKVRAEAEKPVLASRQELAEAESKLAATRADLENVLKERAEARTEEQRLATKFAGLTTDQILTEYATQRSAEYGRQLGLLAEVRNDLRELEAAIEKNNRALLANEASADAEIPNRIVLYIDDLDRCPPDKVVEVLEAVHLLLSFRMFVVIVAVDSRWLRSALTDRLVALRASDGIDHPTANDYLEKIFQVPFWVQPISLQGRSQLVHGLLHDSVVAKDLGPEDPGIGGEGLQLGKAEAEALDVLLNGDGGQHPAETSPLALSPADLRFIEGLAGLLGDTPRRVKRFVNTLQFLYAMSPPLSADKQLSDRHIVALHAALSEGLPAIASRIAASNPAWVTVGTLCTAASGVDPLPTSEVTRFEAWLAANELDWRDVPLSRFEVRRAMVDRLRFRRPTATQRVEAHGVAGPDVG